jgi:hypothetical protein
MVPKRTIIIYPNPSSTTITVELSRTLTIKNAILTINTMSGQQLITRQITEPKTQIDISNLPQGVYFVRLTNDRTVEIGKFVKQ